jgi:aldehyde dehydrogenase family 7 protein A1
MGVITAFNFPHAVLGWNFSIGAVCGNSTLWKGAPSTPLISIATTKIIHEVLAKNNCPESVLALCLDTRKDIGELMCKDKRYLNLYLNLFKFVYINKYYIKDSL